MILPGEWPAPGAEALPIDEPVFRGLKFPGEESPLLTYLEVPAGKASGENGRAEKFFRLSANNSCIAREYPYSAFANSRRIRCRESARAAG